MPRLTGPSHIDLTVTDVERSAQWWETVMGFTRINSFEQEAFRGCGLWHRSGFTVTVLSHDATTDESFDEKRVGLDHFAFAVADVAELDAWVAHLDGLEVVHSGVIDAHFGPTLVLRDPDNIQLELFVFNPDGEDLTTLVGGDPHRGKR
jgi:glyoxylase I family protein